MSRIERWNKQTGVTIPDGTATSGEIDVKHAAGGQIKFPAGVTSPVTWEAKDSSDTWAAIHDDSDVALSSAFTAAKWRPIPEGVMVHDLVRVVAAGNVAGDKTVEVDLKA